MLAVTAGGSDAVTVFVFVVGVLVTVLIALLGWVFTHILNEIRDELKEAKQDLRKTNDHQAGIMATIGPLMWRVIGMEDFLEEQIGYHPPRDIGWAEKQR